MIDKANKNKLIIDRLLNAYSIDAIISSFYTINERIIAIIEFSSEDCIHFNMILRKYHEEFNLLSANSFRLYRCFNEEVNHQYAAEIENSIAVLSDNLHCFENLIEFNRKVHEQLLQKLEQIYLPVNSFYQDLNTLRLLSANLNLDPVIHSQHGERLNSNIEDIFNSYPNFLVGLMKLKKFVSNSCTTISSLKKNYLDNAYHILSFCQYITDTILEKEQQAKDYKPALEKILDQTKEITSCIAFQLQLKDNIQQRIEHIRQIQGEIISKLSVLVDRTDQADYELAKAKLFFQIKGIALLQSSRMTEANREYQKTIEVINNEFLHLSDCLDDMDVLYKTFSTLNEANDGNGFDADRNIRKEVNLYNEIDAINSIFRLQTEAITQRIMNFSNSFALIFKTSSDFHQIVHTIKQEMLTQNGDKTATIITQMAEVAGELLKTINDVKIVLDENAEEASALLDMYNQQYLGNKYEIIQKHEVRTLSNAFREINYLNREVLQVLNTKNKSFPIPSTLKETIESVRNHEHLENDITHIIRCLDEISEKMKAGDTLHIEEDIKSSDSRYKHSFANSEYRIHNPVAGSVKQNVIIE
jgi:hypothetical protein